MLLAVELLAWSPPDEPIGLVPSGWTDSRLPFLLVILRNKLIFQHKLRVFLSLTSHENLE